MAFFKLPFQRPRTPEEHSRNGTTVEAWLQRYYSTVGKSADQSVTSGVVATIDFDTTPWEDRPFFDATANTWTIPADGLWELHLTVTWVHTVDTGQDCTAIWNIDGSLFEGSRSSRSVNSGMGSIAALTLPLRKGQVVTPQAYAFATTPVILGHNGSGNNHRYTRAHVQRVGPHPDDQYR